MNAEEHIKHVVSGKHILYDIGHLNRWWGPKKVTDISAAQCRNYASFRNAGASSRRELAFLNAAIQHWKTNHAPMMPTQSSSRDVRRQMAALPNGHREGAT